jgi:Cdc6-like AAA superfamily ATPase
MSVRIDQLTPEALKRVTRELLNNDAELRCDSAFHDEITEGVLKREDELSGLLQGEIEAARDARRRWHGPWTVAALTAFSLSVLFLVWTIFRSVGIPFRSSRADIAFSLVLVSLGTLAVVRRWSVLRRHIRLAAAELRAALLPPLRALIRLMISELQSDEVHWSNTLQTTKAPALVELNLQDTISSASYKRLQAFIDGHESSAVGLAGPRGSGKTTLMRQLERDESLDCHVAVVSAPVNYSPTEFTRLIHGDLARAGLKPTDASLIRHRMAAPTLRAIMPAAKALLALVVLLLLLVLWLYDKDRPRPKSFDLGWIGLTAVAGGTLVIGFILSKAWSLFQGRTKLMYSARTTRELCWQQLEFLRWSATVEASANTAFKVSGSGFEGSNKLSRTERELTHAESVRALKQFIDQMVALSGKSVIICVDELDKLANPDDAVGTINGIKDLFHVPKGHFVLSVSTDAMHSFAARGVPVRDVFDSAFDTIIPISPLTFDESRTLISRRARDFSATMVMFCHAWSGGHARDLIRTSRSCVEFRCALEDDKQATVAALARQVLHTDLREVVDATLEKLRGEDDAGAEAMLDQVLAFQEAIETEGVVLYEAIEAGTFPDEARTASSEGQQLAAALAPYVRIAGLCERLFSTPRAPVEWQSEAVREAVTALAEARRSLGRHPREIERRLKRAVAACAVAEAAVTP